MATYLIGDVHGCYEELTKLLKQVQFTPYRDKLWLTGDLVSRGPRSIEVLRYVKSLGDSVRVVLGNHDLHLLSACARSNRNKLKNLLSDLFKESDAKELLNWLRFQPLIQIDEEKKLIMVHAGVPAQWNLDIAKKCAYDLESVLRTDLYPFILNAMYKLTVNKWSENLSILARLQFICNAFTRMRYCFPDGKLDLSCKDAPKKVVKKSIKPWFKIRGPISEKYSIVFGHWSSLEGEDTPNGIYALDTGCCWGGKLTCLHWESKTYFFQSSKMPKYKLI